MQESQPSTLPFNPGRASVRAPWPSSLVALQPARGGGDHLGVMGFQDEFFKWWKYPWVFVGPLRLLGSNHPWQLKHFWNFHPENSVYIQFTIVDDGSAIRRGKPTLWMVLKPVVNDGISTTNLNWWSPDSGLNSMGSGDIPYSSQSVRLR